MVSPPWTEGSTLYTNSYPVTVSDVAQLVAAPTPLSRHVPVSTSSKGIKLSSSKSLTRGLCLS